MFRALFILLSCASLISSVPAADPPSAVGSMLKLLKSGRVPESRQGTIVKLICDRGNEHDLRYIFDQAVDPEIWSDDLRNDALNNLVEASRTRNVTPHGDLSELVNLLNSMNSELLENAIELAAQWKVESTFDSLEKIVNDADRPAKLKADALSAMSKIAPQQTQSLLVSIIDSDASFNERASAIQTLSLIDVNAAASFAAKTFKTAGEHDSPETLMNGFLDQQGGSKILAEAIEKTPPSADTAKLALRHMFSIGRTDPELSATLSNIAGIQGDPKPPTKEELAKLVNEVIEHGDAVRGEEVFRRKDLSCMNCHAVSKAGGQIGPDLSAIGASSPVEYVVMSVLDPDQAIKEAYTTKVVITLDGRIHQGLVDDRTANALVLKDATGKKTSIPIEDIDEEIEGKSLMPKGLVKFMTKAEVLDLGKFLATLGKPGPFSVRSTQRMQRWRFLIDAPSGLIEEVPTLSTFEDLVLRATTWKAAYSRVGGELPIGEITAETGHDVVYIQGEVDVSSGGEIELQLNSTSGLTIWINDEMLDPEDLTWNATPGVHAITIRIDTENRAEETIKLELHPVSGSSAKFAVVDGQ